MMMMVMMMKIYEEGFVHRSVNEASCDADDDDEDISKEVSFTDL